MSVGLIISLLFLIAVGYLFYRQSRGPVLATGSTLNTSLDYSIASGGSSVFLHYSHASIDDWLEWLKEQNEQAIEQAKELLLDYLTNNYDCFNVVTLDVIESLSEIGTYTDTKLLINVLNSAGSDSEHGEKSLQIYEATLKALINLSPELSLRIYQVEVKNFIASKEHLEILMSCLSYFPEEDYCTDIWISQFTNSGLGNRYKEMLFQSLSHKSISFQNKVLSSLLSNYMNVTKQKINLSDVGIMHITADKIIKASVENPSLWSLIFDAYAYENTHEIIHSLLVEHLADDQFNISLETILHIALELEGSEKLIMALAIRAGLDEKILRQIEEGRMLESTKFDSDTFCRELIKAPDISYDPWLQDKYSQATVLLRNKYLVPVLHQAALIDKLLLVRLYSIKKRRALYYIDAKKIAIDFSLAEKALQAFDQVESIVVFVHNIEYLDKVSQKSGDKSTIIGKLRKKLANLAVSNSVNLIVSTSLDEAGLKDYYQKQKSHTPLASQNSAAYIEFSYLEASEREELIQDVIVSYEFSNAINIDLIESLVRATEDFSIAEIYYFTQEYVKWSYIIFGTLVDFSQFYMKIDSAKIDQLLRLQLF